MSPFNEPFSNVHTQQPTIAIVMLQNMWYVHKCPAFVSLLQQHFDGDIDSTITIRIMPNTASGESCLSTKFGDVSHPRWVWQEIWLP